MDDGRNVQRVHPRSREVMPYNRPSRFWDGGRHYFGHRIHHLPPHYIPHVFCGLTYYLCNDIWYRSWGGCYYVCRPPFGWCFDPVADIVYATCRFAYYNDVYCTYNTINENARIITQQNEVIAANNAAIAAQNETMALNSQKASQSRNLANSLGLVQSYADAATEYFYDDGVFYVKGADGKYTVIVPPAGALVQDLPEDYDTIVLGGNEYYKVDDTVYRCVVVDGSAYFEVLGQLTGELAEKYNLNQ